MMIRLAIIILGFWSATLDAAEPLRGPEVTSAVWQQNSGPEAASSQTVKNKFLTHQRSLYLDIPIPLALRVAMPFLTTRYLDRNDQRGFGSDQRYGMGLLHHAAEGDPAWRLDFERLGPITARPAHHSRLIINLVKYFTSLRLRPSDTTFSWTGLNVFGKPGHKTLIVPELGWTRSGPDGLYVDLVLPKQAVLGYRGPVFAFTAGVRQDLRAIQANDVKATHQWVVERQAKLTLGAKYATVDYGEMLFSFSTLKALSQLATIEKQESPAAQSPAAGLEVSMQWVPNS